MEPFQISTNSIEENNGTLENITEFRYYSPSELVEAVWARGGWEIPAYAMLFLFSVLANVTVIISLWQMRRQRTITKAFVLNLALSDLIKALFCMPFSLIDNVLQDFVFGEWACRFIPFIKGQRQQNTSRIQETSFAENVEHHEGFLKKCETRARRHLNRQQRAGTENNNRPAETATVELRQMNPAGSLLIRKRVARMIHLVILEFFICWAPLFITANIIRYDPAVFDSDIAHKVISVCEISGYFSGFINPTTYILLSKGVRHKLSKVFKCRE